MRWPSSSRAGGVGILKCCQALSAASQSRAFVLPFALGIEDVSSTVVSAMGRCRVMNFRFHRVRRADIDGVFWDFGSMRRCSLTRRMGMLPLVACPWETGCRLQDGWTSPAVTSRWSPTSSSCRLTQVQQPQKARNWWDSLSGPSMVPFCLFL